MSTSKNSLIHQQKLTKYEIHTMDSNVPKHTEDLQGYGQGTHRSNTQISEDHAHDRKPRKRLDELSMGMLFGRQAYWKGRIDQLDLLRERLDEWRAGNAAELEQVEEEISDRKLRGGT